VPPTITQAPQDATVCLGANATFTVAASGSGTLTYQWKQLVSGSLYNLGTGTSLPLSTAPGPGSPTPPYTNTYYVVVTDSANAATSQAGPVYLSVSPNPSQVEIQLWGQTSDHVWAQLNSPDQINITYRYSYDYGSSWSPWENDGYYYFWPYVGPLGYPSGSIEVQAFVVNGYGCQSQVVQGAYTF